MHQSTVDYSRKWLVMAGVAMGIFLATIDGSIVNIALPELVTELGATFAVVEWVVLAYLLTITVLMLGIGRLADMIGKKPLYTAGLVIFTIGSGLCGLSPTVYVLIACRVFQAFGAAMIMALGTAIITEAFPPAERGRALGISGLMVSLGIIAGPTLGGLILGAFSWHWIFFVNLPIGVVGVLTVLRFVPDTRPAGGQRFDISGALALLLTLLALLFGLTLGQAWGFGDSRVAALLGAAVLGLAAFLAIEKRQSQPMVDLSLFGNSLFSINLATGLLTFICGSGTTLLMPFYLQNVLKYNASTTGLLLSVVPVTLGIAAPLSGWLSDRYGTRRLTVVGLVLLTGGYLGISSLSVHTTAVGYMLRFLPIGIGLGFFQSPNNSAVMGAVSRQRLGLASGLLAITRTLGQTTGTAVLGAIWASQVVLRAGPQPDGNAALAPAAAQIAALNFTSLIVVALIGLALLLSLWALRQEAVEKAQRQAA